MYSTFEIDVLDFFLSETVLAAIFSASNTKSLHMSINLASSAFGRYTVHYMPKSNTANPRAVAELAKVMSKLDSQTSIQNFLYDVATPQEIDTLSQRFQIAKLLWTTNLSYLEIAKRTGASTTTVTRVARFLNQEPFGGYREALQSQYQKVSEREK